MNEDLEYTTTYSTDNKTTYIDNSSATTWKVDPNIYGPGSGYQTGGVTWSDSIQNTNWSFTDPAVLKRLEAIEKRLGILDDPDPAILEKHAALKAAYEHYKMLEKIILGGDE